MINWNVHSPLTALTHLDGRNAKKLIELRKYFSELAWMKTRLEVMVRYLIVIVETVTKKPLLSKTKVTLRAFYLNFSTQDCVRVKRIEKTINHDLRALHEYLARFLRLHGYSGLSSYINLGIGSEDINAVALSCLLRESRYAVILPELVTIGELLATLAKTEKHTVMIARTHARPAGITTFGKELANFLSRLCDEYEYAQSVVFTAKCTGETGSLLAHYAIDRSVDWLNVTNSFVRSFDLNPVEASTQISPYDGIAAYLHGIYRVNTILLDFCRNIWMYVLLEYVLVQKVPQEVGSAGMPHKVNPIYFEGAEGGLLAANGMIETLVRTLPVNRLQRDFSDSTLRRNLVLPFAYSLLSYQSIIEGLRRIKIDRTGMQEDLAKHQEAWIETVKTYGLAHGVSDMYERLKKKTRGKSFSARSFDALIQDLSLTESQKEELHTYCSYSANPYPARIVERVCKRAKRVFKQ